MDPPSCQGSSHRRTPSLGKASPQPAKTSVDSSVEKKGKKSGKLPERDYGVGTLIVRIVAAKNLPAAIPGSFFFTGSSNPYCMFDFEGQVAYTSVISDSLDPVWPREQYFFEVKMPAAHADSDEAASATMKEAAKSMFSAAEPHLHVRVIHRANPGSKEMPAPPVVSDPSVVVKPKANPIPPGDKLVGEAFVNVVDLTTARVKTIDGWFPLSEGGSVKLAVEYDVVDPTPAPGEMVRLLGFGSAADLWPLPIKEEFVVEGYSDPHKERLLISWPTNEGWKCLAEVHRFHVISSGRHKSIIVDYQNRVLDAAIDFMDTPLMAAVGKALDKAEEEGLGAVKDMVVEGFKKGASRWWHGGLSTAFSDVSYLLGNTPDVSEAGGTAQSGVAEKAVGVTAKVDDVEYTYEFVPQDMLDQIMCPITGTPMKDPVVAADGHTYEREAIERWLVEHDTSPLTGAKMSTTMTFRNYSLLTTIEELRQRNEEAKARQLENPEEKKSEPRDSVAHEMKMTAEVPPPKSQVVENTEVKPQGEETGEGAKLPPSEWVAMAKLVEELESEHDAQDIHTPLPQIKTAEPTSPTADSSSPTNRSLTGSPTGEMNREDSNAMSSRRHRKRRSNRRTNSFKL